MGALTFPLILLAILAVFAVIFFTVTKKQEKAANLLEKDSQKENRNLKNKKKMSLNLWNSIEFLIA